MENCSKKLKFYLFADDTNLLYLGKTLKSLEKFVNEELCHLYDWLCSNKLSLNFKKTNYVIFHPYKKKQHIHKLSKCSIIKQMLMQSITIMIILNI